MDDKEEKKNITIDDLAIMVANGFENAKKDLELFKLDSSTHFNNLETDLKSFKNDTKERLDKIDDRLEDIDDTVSGFDKRIEVLEEKVL